MDEAQDLIEYHKVTPYRSLYTAKELGIPGLHILGWYHTHSAAIPIPRHLHRDKLEITIMIHGDVIFFVDGKSYSMNGGDIFVIPANLPHDTGSHPMGICERYHFQLNTNDYPFLYLDREWAANLQQSLKNLSAGVIRGVKFSRKYLAEMFENLTSVSMNNKYMGVTQLLHIINKILESQLKMKVSASPDIQKAVKFINTNLYNQIDLQNLANEAKLSLSRFKQKFQEQIGMSPRVFINLQKMELAKKLLTEKKSITDIAFDLGFNSSSYFSTIFYKFMHITPSEYIKKNSGQGIH